MKALTIHQPWAQLIALGAKTIETRSWSTRYRGPIAIHAGISQKFIGIDYWERHDPEVALTINRALADGGYFPSPSFPPYPMPSAETIRVGLPLGAIVATATLVDVVPMKTYGDPSQDSTGLIIDCPHDGDLPHQQGGMWLIGVNGLTHGRPTRVEDQRPYGDFAPGRHAWLLEDVEPCDPIPAKGRQGLWEWTP